MEDFPNSAGSTIDAAIRVYKIAMDRGIGGAIVGISASTIKHPPIQYRDEIAKRMVEAFIKTKNMILCFELLNFLCTTTNVLFLFGTESI